MSEITEFEQLMPLLDQTELSEVTVHLDNKLALDISDFVKSKGIHHDKMCNWLCQISDNHFNQSFGFTFASLENSSE